MKNNLTIEQLIFCMKYIEYRNFEKAFEEAEQFNVRKN